ncbi:NAD(P)H nitroreductase [Thalassomonas sp. M1454]|uniref:NAD(P)H nitroreductase n=1 Tax=Thalassomonas sp. M1454 TaxID=2594477 RepID=UPI00117E6728|nr:NAD(P)H nitroreductase [Thalassomonas sp. M1454]TRX56854.1 NAD(P)H nitroreductase [Thalassomonas sp. M1454]
MTPIQFLINRQSCSALSAPGPNDEQLNAILNAAMASPDHAGLAPYHFHVISGDGLDKLSAVYQKAIKATTDNELKIEKSKKMAYRAPMTIVVSTKFQQHPKVPVQEQLMTAGCATHAMQMACVALGFGAIWRSGDLAYSDIVKQELGIKLDDEIVGFLYIGTATKDCTQKVRKTAEPFTTYWR